MVQSEVFGVAGMGITGGLGDGVVIIKTPLFVFTGSPLCWQLGLQCLYSYPEEPTIFRFFVGSHTEL